jgi:hypothetical protein
VKWLIPYAGETYTFDDEHISVSEARVQKAITDGMRPSAAEEARQEMDPDAWVAALVIARRRIGMEPADALDINVDEVDLMACMAATRAAGHAELAELKAAKAKVDAPAKPRARSRKAATPEPDAPELDPAT